MKRGYELFSDQSGLAPENLATLALPLPEVAMLILPGQAVARRHGRR